MAIIRRVFGPFSPEEYLDQKEPELRWYFHAIRGDKTMGHWALIYYVNTRKFRAANIPIGEMFGKRNRKIAWDLPQRGIAEDVHPDAWLDGSPVMEGTIWSILKHHLKPEDVVRATALAITRR